MERIERTRGEFAHVAHRVHQVGVIGEVVLDVFKLVSQVALSIGLALLFRDVSGIQQQATDRIADEHHVVGNLALGGGQLVLALKSGGAGGGQPKRQANAGQQQHDQQPERGVQALPDGHDLHGLLGQGLRESPQGLAQAGNARGNPWWGTGAPRLPHITIRPGSTTGFGIRALCMLHSLFCEPDN